MTARQHTSAASSDSQVAARFRREIEGEVLFDSFSRGRYSTDASIYQIDPTGVVIAKSVDDIRRAISIAADAGLSVVPRGGGSSQNGQSIGPGIVIDTTKHLDSILDFSPDRRQVTVQPGIVLDRLNAFLKPHGLHFAVDPSTSSRATIGGMAGNNSSGAHSIQYGLMADNVLTIDAVLASGDSFCFGGFPEDLDAPDVTPAYRDLLAPLYALGRDEADEIEARFPKVLRRVGGYNVDSLVPGAARTRGNAAARLMVGSEGTLAFSTALTLKLHPLPKHKVLGICHFPTFRAAMESARHIVELNPAGVELIDATMIDLARDIPLFRPTIEEFVKGTPAAVLVVEFTGDEPDEPINALKRLDELMADLGHADSVVEALDAKFQGRISAVRKAGLNIMMSMKGDGKPVSIIEDCAVPLEHLADYTSQLTDVFARHGTTGTWYAHASVGCLHVRPVLNMKQELGATAMRAIAEEAFDLVRRYKGSHSGEHGDGISRSEFHGAMFGQRMVDAFETVKDTFDPKGIFNPGKIVRSYRMDDRNLFRFRPGYEVKPFESALDWSEWGGIGGAAEMCNNNGACRKFDVDVMCPSFRATRDEKHSTRGRANTLRLALSGQLGPDALTSEEMAETMQLCVGCKACKRECPTGVDMARLKIEYLHQSAKKNGIKLRDRLVAYLPRYVALASALAPVLNLMAALPGAPWLVEKLIGFSRKRRLPRWRRDRFMPNAMSVGPEDGPEVVLLCDTFNASFEPETLSDAASVLVAAGYRVHFPKPTDGGRPLCCGRTFLTVGLVDEARVEAERMLDALLPYCDRSIPIVGLEPSCLLTLRDEYLGLLPGPRTHALAGQALMFEEFLAREAEAGRLKLPVQSKEGTQVLLHGHCHQKAFDLMGSIGKTLDMVPGVEVETVKSSCCGMAGAFGYGADTHDVSMAMAEDALLPAVRESGSDAVIIADGTSCRQQIRDGTGKNALHVATFIKSALIDDAGAGKT
jgi:FAD/FMN-containing dehydrogenase/Fe-S oxidoreductase